MECWVCEEQMPTIFVIAVVVASLSCFWVDRYAMLCELCVWMLLIFFSFTFNAVFLFVLLAMCFGWLTVWAFGGLLLFAYYFFLFSFFFAPTFSIDVI